VMEEKAKNEDTTPHMANFFEGVRKRDYRLMHAEIEIGARSAAFCHLANISYRVSRTLRMNQSTGRILADEEANAMLTRNYRKPYVVPRDV